MTTDLASYVQPGIIGVLGLIVTVLFAKRASNKVETDNARANRESRFEDNLQARYEAAMGRISELTAERDELNRKLAETRMSIVQIIADGDPKRAVEMIQDSAFVDLSRPLRPRQQAKPSPSPHDPFQAADPYAPKQPKPPKRPR